MPGNSLCKPNGRHKKATPDAIEKQSPVELFVFITHVRPYHSVLHSQVLSQHILRTYHKSKP